MSYLVCIFSKLRKKISKIAQNPLVLSMKKAQNLYLSISKFSRDSRQKIPGSPGLKKGRESREFPCPGIPGAELYLFPFKSEPAVC